MSLGASPPSWLSQTPGLIFFGTGRNTYTTHPIPARLGAQPDGFVHSPPPSLYFRGDQITARRSGGIGRRATFRA